MIIYQIEKNRSNVKNFVLAGTIDDMHKRIRLGEPDHFRCYGKKKGDGWNPPEIEWFDGHKKKVSRQKDPDIAGAHTAISLIASSSAAELLRPAIEKTCELLPVPLNGDTWYFINVLNFVEGAVDVENSEYEINNNGKRIWMNRPLFFPKKLPHAQLFMITEKPSRIYYAEHHPDNNPNTFKNILENNNLFGITLKKIDEYKTVSGV